MDEELADEPGVVPVQEHVAPVVKIMDQELDIQMGEPILLPAEEPEVVPVQENIALPVQVAIQKCQRPTQRGGKNGSKCNIFCNNGILVYEP